MSPLFGGITLPGRPDLSNIRKLDLLPARAILEMEKYGFAVDLDRLKSVSVKLADEMDSLRSEICSTIPEDKLDEFVARSGLDDSDIESDGWLPMNVDSNVQLAKLLFEVLGIGKGRRLKSTKGGKQVSTGKKQLEQLRIEHPVVGKTLMYRERAKLRNTYTNGLPKLVKYHPKGKCWCGLAHIESTVRLHTEILSTRANTGRYSSKAPNLQNIPVRSELGQEIRRAFVASQGMELVGVDFSQIELRDLAHLSNADSMIEIYRANGDIHDHTARVVFQLAEDIKPDKIKHRMASKRVNFGIQNGTTEVGLHAQLVMDYCENGLEVPDWLTLEWCKWFIKQWMKAYPETEAYFEDQHYRAVRYGYVWDSFGRIKRIPEVQSVHQHVCEGGMRQAQNMPVTSLAAGQMKLALAEVQEWIEKELRPSGLVVYPLLTVHDEGIWEIEQGCGEAFKEVAAEIFANVMVDKESGEDLCRVPIMASSDVMERWEK